MHRAIRNLHIVVRIAYQGPLWENNHMSAQRWFLFALSIVLGLGLGLLYGWVISPVQYVDTTPSTLRADFKTDYTLMVAETFQSEQNLEQAARSLASLGSQPPAQIAAQALTFAQNNHYAAADIGLLQNLAVALQVWQPPAGNAEPSTSAPALPAATPAGSQP
jgi:hypothetical protein